MEPEFSEDGAGAVRFPKGVYSRWTFMRNFCQQGGIVGYMPHGHGQKPSYCICSLHNSQYSTACLSAHSPSLIGHWSLQSTLYILMVLRGRWISGLFRARQAAESRRPLTNSS